jgi:hypothetical protein
MRHIDGMPQKLKRYEDQYERALDANAGIITPKGAIVPCNPYNHMETFLQGSSPAMQQKWASLLEEIKSKKERWCQDAPEGLPEWHLFETWEDNQKSETRHQIMEEFYNNGYIRFALYHGREAFIEFEGTREAINKQRKLQKDLAIGLAARLGREPRISTHVVELNPPSPAGLPRYDPAAEKGRGETVTGPMKSREEKTRTKISMSHMDHKMSMPGMSKDQTPYKFVGEKLSPTTQRRAAIVWWLTTQ